MRRWCALLILSLLPLHANVETSLQEHIKFSETEPNLIGHIMIDRSMISQGTWIYVKAALDEYRELKPIFIILELDTPGGQVFPAEQISTALTDFDVNEGIPVVAFIDHWAISAGALLAYSARFIAVTKDSSMGAAEPILMSPQGGTETASEKIRSALRATFANRAAFFDRDPDIAEAMVDKDIILVMRQGRIMRLDTEDQIVSTGPDPDQVISPEGKLLTLNAKQLMEYGVADLMVPLVPMAPITEAERKAGRWPASKSPLFAAPFFKEIPHAEIVAYQAGWRIKFFSFLSNPIVSSILFLGLMIGFYMELSTPGFGAAGAIGLICLFFIVLASFSTAASSWLEVLLLLGGLGLLALELFIIPGFGIAGIFGIILIVVSIFLLLLPGFDWIGRAIESGELGAAGQEFVIRLAYLAGTLIVGAVLIGLLSRFVLPRFSRFSTLVLKGEQVKEKGFVAGPDRATLPEVGSVGQTMTRLNPAGKVVIEGEIYPAMSEEGYLDKGMPIAIVRYEGSHMFVQTRPSE